MNKFRRQLEILSDGFFKPMLVMSGHDNIPVLLQQRIPIKFPCCVLFYDSMTSVGSGEKFKTGAILQTVKSDSTVTVFSEDNDPLLPAELIHIFMAMYQSEALQPSVYKVAKELHSENENITIPVMQNIDDVRQEDYPDEEGKYIYSCSASFEWHCRIERGFSELIPQICPDDLGKSLLPDVSFDLKGGKK